MRILPTLVGSSVITADNDRDMTRSVPFAPVVSLRTGLCWAVEAARRATAIEAVEQFADIARTVEYGLVVSVDPESIALGRVDPSAIGMRLDANEIARGRMAIVLVEHDVENLDAMVQ